MASRSSVGGSYTCTLIILLVPLFLLVLEFCLCSTGQRLWISFVIKGRGWWTLSRVLGLGAHKGHGTEALSWQWVAVAESATEKLEGHTVCSI